MSNNTYILILYGNIAQKTYAFRNRNIRARNIISTKWQLSAALCVWNGQILARSECNYIIWTRSTLVVLEDFTSIPHVHAAEFALTLEDCIHVCTYASAITMSHCAVSALRGMRVLQRVSEPRHSKAITVMSYTRYCSQLHRHSARSRIIFYGDACACCETFAHKRFERKLVSRAKTLRDAAPNKIKLDGCEVLTILLHICGIRSENSARKVHAANLNCCICKY